ncbi:MAG: MBL fold metallo-hydrolase [Clostridiales bacterium]|nr:MBL fold metallo-hydrolase [Clostridiales bacterium]
MKLTFYGAARTVTGSCHCLEACGRRILIDCGLQQGSGEIDNAELPFHPGELDLVILTHAHIDHSGRVPLLYKRGYEGRVITTHLTKQLLAIMLMDSAHIQESEAEWANQKGKRAGRPVEEPLYTQADALVALEQIDGVAYGERIPLFEGIELNMVDAGHLLGSAFVELFVEEAGERRKLVFSGDIGNLDQPIIRDPSMIDEADYVVMESTYGTRLHEGEGDYTKALAEVLDETFERGGNVIIPAFAVGRTQELLYFLREIKLRGLVRSLPDFPVYVDSPLARQATQIFAGDLTGCLDQEARDLLASGSALMNFPGLCLCESVEESKWLNQDPNPKVVISASGMCDAGRIRHHLKHNLWRPECAIVFVGFQAEGSFGRHLLSGAERVRMFGEEIRVAARIVNLPGMSSHADRDFLLKWARHFSPTPRHIFVVHGEEQGAEALAAELNRYGIPAHAPFYLEEFDLIRNLVSSPGIPLPAKARKSAHESQAYAELLGSAEQLLELVKTSRQGANRELRAMNRQLTELLAGWGEK